MRVNAEDRRCSNAVFRTLGSALTRAWKRSTRRQTGGPAINKKKQKKDKVRSAWIPFAGRMSRKWSAPLRLSRWA